MYPGKCHTIHIPVGAGSGTAISPVCGYGYLSVSWMSHNPALVPDPHTCISTRSAGSDYMIFIQVAGLFY